MQEELKLSKNTAKLHQMFGKKLYGNKFSFISEICQNAVDSHRMAGEKDPVVVGIRHKIGVHGNSLGNLQFYVKDIGLSFENKEDFIDKVCTILESGKSEEKTADENCAMGMHGIGSISVSAYQSSWKYTVVTRDQRKFTCTLQEVEGKGLTYEMSDYTPSDDFRSVLFEVDLQTHYSSLAEFVTALKEKLCYFKDIQFDFSPDVIRLHKELLTLNTDFKIFQGPDFQVSTMSKQSEMHINLDQYSYPIKWNLLNIAPIKLNIGLKFSMVDGLVPDITRENLIHNDDYKAILSEKIHKVADWFINKYNESALPEYESIKDYTTALGSPKAVVINEQPYVISELEKYTKVVPGKISFKDVSEKTIKSFLEQNNGKDLYNLRYEINHNGHKVAKDNYYYSRFTQPKCILFDPNKKMSTSMVNYLKAAYRGAGLYTRKNIHLHKGDMSYRSLMGLKSWNSMKVEYKSSGKNVYRNPIEQFCILQKSFEKDYMISVESIKVPPEYIKAKAKPIKKQKVSIDDLSGEVSIKFGKPMTNNSVDFDCKFENRIVKVRDLAGLPGLYIYGLESERRQLDWAYKLTHYGSKNDVSSCIITETQQVHIKKLKLKNFMNVTDFFAGKHDTFRRIVTSYLISTELENAFSNIFVNKDIIKKHLCTKFGEDLEKLELYCKNYSTQEFGKGGYPRETFMESILAVAKQGNLYDPVYYPLYISVKEDIEKFEFIDFFVPTIKEVKYGKKDETVIQRAVDAMTDLAKQRKINQDWKNYTLEV